MFSKFTNVLILSSDCPDCCHQRRRPKQQRLRERERERERELLGSLSLWREGGREGEVEYRGGEGEGARDEKREIRKSSRERK
jgi:hypothetical protein